MLVCFLCLLYVHLKNSFVEIFFGGGGKLQTISSKARPKGGVLENMQSKTLGEATLEEQTLWSLLVLLFLWLNVGEVKLQLTVIIQFSLLSSQLVCQYYLSRGRK